MDLKTQIYICSLLAVISFTELQNVQVGRLVGIGEGEGDLAVPIPVEKRWTDKD